MWEGKEDKIKDGSGETNNTEWKQKDRKKIEIRKWIIMPQTADKKHKNEKLLRKGDKQKIRIQRDWKMNNDRKTERDGGGRNNRE